MEVDLKQLRDIIREENASSHAETRQQFVVVAEGMRREFVEVELKQALDTIREENASSHVETRRQLVEVADRLRHEFVEVALKQAIDTLREESASSHVETRQHFDVVAEGMRHELQIIAEGVILLNEKLDTVATDLDTRVTRLEVASSSRGSQERRAVDFRRQDAAGPAAWKAALRPHYRDAR